MLISNSKNPSSSLLMFILSSTKLEIRAKQSLLGSEGVGARGRRWGEMEGAGRRGE
jgi:hypothetical protein